MLLLTKSTAAKWKTMNICVARAFPNLHPGT